MPTDTITLFLDDLSRDFNDLTAAHAFSVAGIQQYAQHLATPPDPLAGPDPVLLARTALGTHPAGWRRSEAREQVRPMGPIEVRLGHLWIISLYALWDSQYRGRLAALHGNQVEEEKYDLFGDLRLLRNDVVHRHGIASAGETGRCVLLHWFQVGQEIRLESCHLNEFFSRIPWSSLVNGPGAA